MSKRFKRTQKGSTRDGKIYWHTSREYCQIIACDNKRRLIRHGAMVFRRMLTMTNTRKTVVNPLPTADMTL